MSKAPNTKKTELEIKTLIELKKYSIIISAYNEVQAEEGYTIVYNGQIIPMQKYLYEQALVWMGKVVECDKRIKAKQESINKTEPEEYYESLKG